MLNEINCEKELIGSIFIDKLKLLLPIHLGALVKNTDEDGDQRIYTSVPSEKNVVDIYSVRCPGIGNTLMFRNIDRLAIGDEVHFINNEQDKTYLVTAVKMIWPDKLQQLLIGREPDTFILTSSYPEENIQYCYVVYCELVDCK